MDNRSKILIVDDRKENITAIETLLEDLDVDVISVSSGNEALAKTLEHNFALALIDVQMPDMDGYETVRFMRKVERTRFLPVIFISAIYSNDPYMLQGIEAGAVDFITKPFNPQILLGKIRIFLDLHYQKQMLEAEIERRNIIENQLTEAKLKAEESDKLKSAFLANMSHEIRTPLTTIVGMSNLLATKDYPIEKRKEIAAHIDKSSESLLTIINDILDMAKIESGEVKIKKNKTDLTKLLNDFYKSYKFKLKNNKLKLDFRLNIHDQPKVFPETDEIRIRQILSNVVSNAFKFTTDGYIEISYKVRKGFIDISVEDSGSGIPQDKFSFIFERFQKLDDRTSGTGLGLPIAKNLAELIGGSINVKSEIGNGSKFTLTIPYNGNNNEDVKESPGHMEVKKEISDLSSKSILIAEDEYPIYFLLETLLAPTKIKITWAKNGREALDVFSRTNDFDAILLDINMPEMNGIETFKEIRKINKDIPVIAQTAFVMNDDRNFLENIGFNGFISKPFVRNDIIELIDRLVQ